MSWTCSVYGGEERRGVYRILGVGLREVGHLGDTDAEGSIILR